MNIENNNNMVENGSANDICEKIKPILSLAITTVPMQEANWDGVYSMGGGPGKRYSVSRTEYAV